MTSKPTVLVVHSEKAVREILVSLLQSFGLNAQAGFHGEEAAELALLGKVQAIVFVDAPDMKASLLVEQIRYGGALTGIICGRRYGDPESDRITQDSRTRVLHIPFSLRQAIKAVSAVSPACDRAAKNFGSARAAA